MNIFISYAIDDLISFRISEIVNYLEEQNEIRKVFYWDRDSTSSMRILEYMENGIKASEIIIVFCSENSLNSNAVNLEIDFAIMKNKRIIPVFNNINNVRDIIRTSRGVQFSDEDFNDFLNLLTIIIKGSDDVPLMVHANQILFNKLKRLIIKLFNSRTETAYSFVNKLLRSEEIQDFFGLAVRNREPLDDQKIYFLDGLYYIIPNSKTLRKIVNDEVTQLLTRNTLRNMTEEEILDILEEFFTDIRAYVRIEHNQDIF